MLLRVSDISEYEKKSMYYSDESIEESNKVYCCECGKEIIKIPTDDVDTSDEEDYPICKSCSLLSDIDFIEKSKKSIIIQLILTGIGFIAGLLIGLDLNFGWVLVKQGWNAPFMVVYFPFLFGSIIAIIKKIKDSYSGLKTDPTKEDSGIYNFVVVIFIIIFYLLIAPIITIIKIVKNIVLLVRYNKIYKYTLVCLAEAEEEDERAKKNSNIEAKEEL